MGRHRVVLLAGRRRQPGLGPAGGRVLPAGAERRRPRHRRPQQLHVRPALHARPRPRVDRAGRRGRLHAERALHRPAGRPRPRRRAAARRAVLRPLRERVPGRAARRRGLAAGELAAVGGLRGHPAGRPQRQPRPQRRHPRPALHRGARGRQPRALDPPPPGRPGRAHHHPQRGRPDRAGPPAARLVVLRPSGGERAAGRDHHPGRRAPHDRGPRPQPVPAHGGAGRLRPGLRETRRRRSRSPPSAP